MCLIVFGLLNKFTELRNTTTHKPMLVNWICNARLNRFFAKWGPTFKNLVGIAVYFSGSLTVQKPENP